MIKFRTVLCVFLISITSVLVAACYRSIPGSGVDQFPLFTPTKNVREFIETQDPLPTPTVILTNSTPKLSPTSPSSAEPLSTKTPETTPTLRVQLPVIQGDASNFLLINSQSEALIKLQLSRSSQFLYTNTKVDDLLYPAFHSIIDHEWKKTYRLSREPLQLIKLIPSFYDHSKGRLTNTMLIDIIGDYIIHHLNTHEIALANKSSIQVDEFIGFPYLVEIDRDITDEWLIQISNPEGYYLGEDSFWITLNQDSSGQYQRLENQIPWQYGFSSINRQKGLITDLSGDTLSDIIVMEVSTAPGGSRVSVHVATGSPEGFKTITSTIEIETVSSLENFSESYEWNTHPINNLPSLKVHKTEELSPWLCEISKTTEYQWVDGVERVISQSSHIPDSFNCAVARSLNYVSPGDYKFAIQALITALKLMNDARIEDQIYVLYRLTLLNLLIGDEGNATHYLGEIEAFAQSGAPTIAVTLMDKIRQVHEGKHLNPYHLCLAAELIAEFDTGTDGNPYSGMKSYPYEGFPDGYPSQLCDTSQMAQNFLSWLAPEPNESLDERLTTAGIPYQHAINMLENPISDFWIVILSDDNSDILFDQQQKKGVPSEKTLSIYGYYDGNWKEMYTALETELLSINLLDKTTDGVIDFSLAHPSNNPDWFHCGANEDPFDIFMITALYSDWLVTTSETFCLPSDEAVNFDLILRDQDGNGIVDTITDFFEGELYDPSLLENIPSNNPTVFEHESYLDLYELINKDFITNDLTNRTLDGNNDINLRSDIDYYLIIWEGENPEEKTIFAQLKYLLALLAERDGDDETAITHFYDIWLNRPESIWAYLASTRLENK